jgi:hypothetical protein
MDWIFHNLQILATLGSATVVYLMLRSAAKKDVEATKKDIQHIYERLGKIEEDLSAINIRLTRLEGSFEERRYWTTRQAEPGKIGVR